MEEICVIIEESDVQYHQCMYCDYSTPKEHLFERHQRVHYNNRPHLCTICERPFKTLITMENHRNTHFGIKPRSCDYCDKSFTTAGELQRHVRYRHTLEKPHKCTECDYESVESTKLKRHFRIHTGERPYQCQHCSYSFVDMFKLKRHSLIHTGEKPFICHVCNNSFNQSNALNTHIKSHYPGSYVRFKCELCPTSCGRKSDLRTHVQNIHMLDVPIYCSTCSEPFTDKYIYKLHKNEHAKELFNCELCDFKTTSKKSLTSHMLRHSNLKPFHCDHCGAVFRQKQLLRRHFNIHHDDSYKPKKSPDKNFRCPICEKAFVYKGFLTNHMKGHGVYKWEVDETKQARVKEENVEAKSEEYVMVDVVLVEGENGMEEMSLVIPK